VLPTKSAAGGNKGRSSFRFIPESHSIANASTMHRKLQAVAAPTIPKDWVSTQRMATNGRNSMMFNLPVTSALPWLCKRVKPTNDKLNIHIPGREPEPRALRPPRSQRRASTGRTSATGSSPERKSQQSHRPWKKARVLQAQKPHRRTDWTCGERRCVRTPPGWLRSSGQGSSALHSA
jgi:hypothetical protein